MRQNAIFKSSVFPSSDQPYCNRGTCICLYGTVKISVGIIGLDSFLTNLRKSWFYLDQINFPVEIRITTVIHFGSMMLPNLKGHLEGFSSRNRGMVHPLSH